MIQLAVGLALFFAAHSAAMLAPGVRAAAIARIGEGPWKGLYAVVSLIGLVLVGRGWSAAEPALLYTPVPGAAHLLLVAMPVLLVLAVAGNLPAGRIRRFARHPMLVATAVWAGLHLLANGDAAAVLLFGAFLVWAVADIASLLARERVGGGAGPHGASPRDDGSAPAERSAPAEAAASPALWPDIAAVGVGLALYAWLVMGGHVSLFGVSPLG